MCNSVQRALIIAAGTMAVGRLKFSFLASNLEVGRMISRLTKRSDATTRKASVNDSELQPIINKESEALIRKCKKEFYQVNSPERYKIAIECYGGQKDCYDIVIFRQ
ncbi:MAG: hypothetical protein GY782_05520 [Gammaproteobacteria bacterium]|nr:hypothetical protein [Gammaproteobacteria bacterium]